MSDYRCIVYKQEGPVASILLDRPDALNALNAQLRKELLMALERADDNAEVRAVILGSSGKAFSSGADLAESLDGYESVEEVIMEEYWPALKKISELEKPVIAAVPGAMAGIGAAFAMACDLMVMADSGYLLMAFSNIGLVPDGGASWNLLRYLGYQRAYRLIAEGGRLSAHECSEAGIANKLAPADQVYAVALRWAEELSQRAPIALREAKKILRRAGSLSFEETVTLEAGTQNKCINTQDAREAVEAFFEKRQPVFKGV